MRSLWLIGNARFRFLLYGSAIERKQAPLGPFAELPSVLPFVSGAIDLAASSALMLLAIGIAGGLGCAVVAYWLCHLGQRRRSDSNKSPARWRG